MPVAVSLKRACPTCPFLGFGWYSRHAPCSPRSQVPCQWSALGPRRHRRHLASTALALDFGFVAGGGHFKFLIRMPPSRERTMRSTPPCPPSTFECGTEIRPSSCQPVPCNAHLRGEANVRGPAGLCTHWQARGPGVVPAHLRHLSSPCAVASASGRLRERAAGGTIGTAAGRKSHGIIRKKDAGHGSDDRPGSR
jgi:hypothetical protein